MILKWSLSSVVFLHHNFHSSIYDFITLVLKLETKHEKFKMFKIALEMSLGWLMGRYAQVRGD